VSPRGLWLIAAAAGAIAVAIAIAVVATGGEAGNDMEEAIRADYQAHLDKRAAERGGEQPATVESVRCRDATETAARCTVRAVGGGSTLDVELDVTVAGDRYEWVEVSLRSRRRDSIGRRGGGRTPPGSLRAALPVRSVPRGAREQRIAGG
jgi:hypothetical protein